MTTHRGPIGLAAALDLLINEIIAADLDADVHAIEDVRDELRAEAERRQVADDIEAARLLRSERFNNWEFVR